MRTLFKFLTKESSSSFVFSSTLFIALIIASAALGSSLNRAKSSIDPIINVTSRAAASPTASDRALRAVGC